MWTVDKPPNPSLMHDIIKGIRVRVRSLVSQGCLVGGDCRLDESMNDKDILKAGEPTIDHNYTPMPLSESLVLCQCIADQYLVNFSNRVSV